MENKYFIPDIEDIRIGYECEIKVADSDLWIKTIFQTAGWAEAICNKEGMHYSLPNDIIRVPYLTKEQIEAEGFIHIGGKLQSESEQIFEGRTIEIRYTFYNYKLKIQHKNYIRDGSGNFDGYLVRYDGYCKDINTFRYICKLLNIK